MRSNRKFYSINKDIYLSTKNSQNSNYHNKKIIIENNFENIDYLKLFQAALKYRQENQLSFNSPFRLINLSGDGVPDVAVDFYANFAAISWYSSGAATQKNKITDALLKLNIKIDGIYEVCRFNSSASAQNYRHVSGLTAPEFFEVNENGSKFLCSFSHGQNAGFFIDNRANRKIISENSLDRKVLNLFAYTGGLSVVAARAGANDVVTVDIAKSYNSWAKKNLIVNGYEDFAEKVLTFDALDYMNFCQKKENFFDFIILDPPSFATSVNKKPFSTKKNYGELLSAAVKILNKNAIILAICNTAGMPDSEFKFIITDALKMAGVKNFQLEKGGGLPIDFKCCADDDKTNYLKNYLIKLD